MKVYGSGDMQVTALNGVTIDFPVGTRVYDVSTNTTPTNTNCFDKITTVSPFNFNGTDIGDGSHWNSTNNYCKTLLFWIQEQSNPTPNQAGSTTNASTTVTVADSSVLSADMSISGTNIPANTPATSKTPSVWTTSASGRSSTTV